VKNGNVIGKIFIIMPKGSVPYLLLPVQNRSLRVISFRVLWFFLVQHLSHPSDVFHHLGILDIMKQGKVERIGEQEVVQIVHDAVKNLQGESFISYFQEALF